MEFLTGIMIAILIYYSGNLIMSDELALNNFFSFLAAMMLAYQPVRSLATLNLTINQGLAAAKRILPIIDQKHNIFENEKLDRLKVLNGTITFEKVNFKYNSEQRLILKNVNLNITGGEMTSLVGHSGAGKSTILKSLHSKLIGEAFKDLGFTILLSIVSNAAKSISLSPLPRGEQVKFIKSLFS